MKVERDEGREPDRELPKGRALHSEAQVGHCQMLRLEVSTAWHGGG